MDYLYRRLPKDIVYIIEDYSKDRTIFNVVLCDMESSIIHFDTCWYMVFRTRRDKQNNICRARLFWNNDSLYNDYLKKYNMVSSIRI